MKQKKRWRFRSIEAAFNRLCTESVVSSKSAFIDTTDSRMHRAMTTKPPSSEGANVHNGLRYILPPGARLGRAMKKSRRQLEK